MTIVELPDKNITLINLNDLFLEQIGSKILKDLKTYKLLDKPLTNKDVKKLFYQFVMHVGIWMQSPVPVPLRAALLHRRAPHD